MPDSVLLSNADEPSASKGHEDSLLARFGLTSASLQKQIERNTRYAYWFTTGRFSPGAWAGVAVVLLGVGMTCVCALAIGATQLFQCTLILAVPALIMAVIAGRLINTVIKRRLSREPLGLREYERARRLERLQNRQD